MLVFIRRIVGYYFIKRYIKKIMPQLDLGNVKDVKCKSFKLGDYSVITNEKTYHLCFWEYVGKTKSFKLWLNDEIGNSEIITFSLSNLFSIKPQEMLIEKDYEREVINLNNGTAKRYFHNNNSNISHIAYHKPFWESRFINWEWLTNGAIC